MRKYRVTLGRTVVQNVTVNLVAKNPSTAIANCLTLADADYFDWDEHADVREVSVVSVISLGDAPRGGSRQ